MSRKSNGFSLIELIVVLVVLAIILLIISPMIVNFVTDFKDKKQDEIIEKNIINAAKLYISDNKYDNNIDCSDNKEKNMDDINIEVLVQSNYLEITDDDKDKISKKDIKVKYNCNTKKYSYNFEKK